MDTGGGCLVGMQTLQKDERRLGMVAHGIYRLELSDRVTEVAVDNSIARLKLVCIDQVAPIPVVRYWTIKIQPSAKIYLLSPWPRSNKEQGTQVSVKGQHQTPVRIMYM